MSNFAGCYTSLSFTFQWPWPYFKVTAVSNSFNWHFYALVRISLNFIDLLRMSSGSWIFHFFPSSSSFFFFFLTRVHIQRRYLKRNFSVAFFSDTIKARSFKLRMNIALLGVYIVIQGLMNWLSFKVVGVSEIWIANCVFGIFLDFFFFRCSLNVLWLLHTWKR